MIRSIYCATTITSIRQLGVKVGCQPVVTTHFNHNLNFSHNISFSCSISTLQSCRKQLPKPMRRLTHIAHSKLCVCDCMQVSASIWCGFAKLCAHLGMYVCMCMFAAIAYFAPTCLFENWGCTSSVTSYRPSEWTNEGTNIRTNGQIACYDSVAVTTAKATAITTHSVSLYACNERHNH